MCMIASVARAVSDDIESDLFAARRGDPREGRRGATLALRQNGSILSDTALGWEPRGRK